MCGCLSNRATSFWATRPLPPLSVPPSSASDTHCQVHTTLLLSTCRCFATEVHGDMVVCVLMLAPCSGVQFFFPGSSVDPWCPVPDLPDHPPLALLSPCMLCSRGVVLCQRLPPPPLLTTRLHKWAFAPAWRNGTGGPPSSQGCAREGTGPTVLQSYRPTGLPGFGVDGFMVVVVVGGGGSIHDRVACF